MISVTGAATAAGNKAPTAARWHRRSKALTGPGGKVRAGFTLLEIILVIGLVALAAGVVIANFTTFLRFEPDANPEDRLRAAIREARFAAAETRSTHSLHFDPEDGALVIAGGAGGESGERFPLGPDFARGGAGASIRFYAVPAASGVDRLPEPLASRLQVPRLYFAPDRSSSPFVASIESAGGQTKRLYFDPFSSLVREVE